MPLARYRLLISILALVLSGCAASRPSERPAPPPTTPLRVGVTPDTAPYVFLPAGQYDHYSGMEIDFAEKLASALGRPLRIVPVPWDEQIPTLLAGRTDVIMSGMSITPARAERVAFAESYLTTALQAAVRRDDATRWPTPQALMQTSPRIGVKAGTTGEAFVRARRPNENIVVYRRSQDAITELLNYRIDVYVSDAPVIEAAVMKHPNGLVSYPRAVGEQSLAWAFRPADVELRQAANAVLQRWRQDGTLRRVLDAWPSVTE
jgi:polar amino acid transport system substrate-binding protein